MPKDYFSTLLKRMKQQQLHNIGLMPLYLPESLSIEIGIQDKNGNALALYQSDYQELIKLLSIDSDVKTLEKFKILPLIDKLHILDKLKLNIIRYISPNNLSQYTLDLTKSHFGYEGDIFSKSGEKLLKAAHQNCVVMARDNQIYIAPKLRSIPGNIDAEVLPEAFFPHSNEKKGIIGMSHSSLANNQRVKFAGVFAHKAGVGWIISNQTGHYATRPYQLRIFLEELQKQGVDLTALTVESYVPKTGKPSSTDGDYTVTNENALECLCRIKASQQAINNAMSQKLTDEESDRRNSSEVRFIGDDQESKAAPALLSPGP